MARRLVLALVLAVVWLLWSGYLQPLLALWAVVSIAGAVALSARLGALDEEGVPLNLWRPRLLPYVAWLTWQVVLSNVDVVRRVWARRPGLDPQVLEVPATAVTAAGRVLYANSITLTPGTITVRLLEEGEDARLLVHALHAGTADDLRGGEMGRRVAALEGA